MTRKQFIERALRIIERSLLIPRGWWGTWRDVTNGSVRVRYSGGGIWTLSVRGKRVSRHDSRAGAISKARKL
jgi:hypothetical protein